MNILIIDNYDSFTYNLVQFVGKYNHTFTILKNDDSLQSTDIIHFDKILISPGPGKPENSGLSLKIIAEYFDTIPILGVCLGMQAIALQFGAKVIKHNCPTHGYVSEIIHSGDGIFKGVHEKTTVMRYHSLYVERETLPECFEITATTADGVIMGLKHRIYSLEGLQFHPESILTPCGEQMLYNWLEA